MTDEYQQHYALRAAFEAGRRIAAASGGALPNGMSIQDASDVVVGAIRDTRIGGTDLEAFMVFQDAWRHVYGRRLGGDK